MSVGARFCVACGGPLEEGAPPAAADGRACTRCGRRHWVNPVPCAGGLVERARGGAREVLLARRARPPARGAWDLPGGFLDPGESPEAAVVRELREETGLTVEVARFLGAWTDAYEDDAGRRDTLNLYYACRVVGGSLAAADDVAEVGWFPADDLPGPMAFAHNAHVLAAWRREHATPPPRDAP